MADRPASRRPGDRLRSPQRCGAAHSPKILADLSERCPVSHTDRYRELPIQQRLRSIPPAFTASTRLQLRINLRDLRPLHHRPNISTSRAPPTRPRRCPRPNPTNRTLHQTPQPERTRTMTKIFPLTAITCMSPVVQRTRLCCRPRLPSVLDPVSTHTWCHLERANAFGCRDA